MSCVPLFGIMSLYVSWDIYIPHWRVWAQSQLCFWFWLPADVHIKRQQVLTQEPVPSAQTEGLMLIFKLLASTWMNSGSCGQFGIWIRTWIWFVCVSLPFKANKNYKHNINKTKVKNECLFISICQRCLRLSFNSLDCHMFPLYL